MCFKELDAVCDSIDYWGITWDFVRATFPSFNDENIEREQEERFGKLTPSQLHAKLVTLVGNWEVKGIFVMDGFICPRLAPPSLKITIGTEES